METRGIEFVGTVPRAPLAASRRRFWTAALRHRLPLRPKSPFRWGGGGIGARACRAYSTPPVLFVLPPAELNVNHGASQAYCR
jgi:hypothetical protein